MKKKLSIMLVFLVVAGGIFAYYQFTQPKPEEFMTYYNETWVPTVAMEEEAILGMISRIRKFEENGETQKIANLVEEEGVPVVEKALKRFEEVEPENHDIKKFNQMTIEQDKQRMELLKQMISYGEKEQSEADLKKAQEKYHDKAMKLVDYSNELKEKYDLIDDFSTDKVGGFRKVKPK